MSAILVNMREGCLRLMGTGWLCRTRNFQIDNFRKFNFVLPRTSKSHYPNPTNPLPLLRILFIRLLNLLLRRIPSAHNPQPHRRESTECPETTRHYLHWKEGSGFIECETGDWGTGETAG